MDAVGAAALCHDVYALQAYLDGEKAQGRGDPSHHLLFAAVEADIPQCLLLLLASGGVDVNLQHPENGRRLLSVAVESAHSLVCVEVLLQAGAVPDLCDDTGVAPLHHAAWHLRPASVRALLTAGAKVDQTDMNGRTALYFAVQTCCSAPSAMADGVVQLLLDAGADVHHLAKNGMSPLHEAAGGAKTPMGVLRLLVVAAGGDLDRGNGIGWTPLMIAISRNRAAAFAELVDAGADLYVRAFGGYTPMTFTMCNGSRQGPRFVRALVRQGVETP